MLGCASSLTGRCLAALAMSVSFAGGCWGQAGTIQQTTRLRLKSDRAFDFEALIKQFYAELRKTGEKRQATWWTSMTGPSEVVSVRHFNKLAELDAWPSPMNATPALASIGVQLRGCVESVETVYADVLPDLSLPSSHEIPKMVRVIRSTVRPDKVNEYRALVKEEILPAVRKSGAKTYIVLQTRMGRPGTEFVSVLGINNWADLDENPVTKAMGTDAWQRFMARRSQLIFESQMDVYRYRPELSYLPEGTAASGGTQ